MIIMRTHIEWLHFPYHKPAKDRWYLVLCRHADGNHYLTQARWAGETATWWSQDEGEGEEVGSFCRYHGICGFADPHSEQIHHEVKP